MDQTALINLVQRAKTFENEACAEIFREFYPYVFSLVMKKLRDRRHAEEVALDVISRAILKSGNLRSDAAFAGWLRNIAFNEVAQLFVPRKKNQAKPILDYDHPAEYLHPAEGLIDDERTDLIWDALNLLPDSDRDLLIDFYFEGMPHNKLVEKYAVPKGTIKRRLNTARRRMKDSLLSITDLEEIIF